VFIKYEAEVSTRVGGGERGVVDFGKLFAETNEQKFSASSMGRRGMVEPWGWISQGNNLLILRFLSMEPFLYRKISCFLSMVAC